MTSKERNSVAPLQLGKLESKRETDAGLTRSTRRGGVHCRPMYSDGGSRSALLPCHALAYTTKTCSLAWAVFADRCMQNWRSQGYQWSEDAGLPLALLRST